jgi:hypothetical protein
MAAASIARGFAEMSSTNLEKLEADKAKAKYSKKSKLKEALQPETPVYSKPVSDPKATKSDIKAIHKKIDDSERGKREKIRIAKVRKLQRYRDRFGTELPPLKHVKFNAHTSEEECDLVLANIRSYFAAQNAPSLIREGFVNIVMGAEKLIFATGSNHAMGLSHYGAGLALQKAMDDDPTTFDPEMGELECEISDWFEQPLIVRLAYKVYSFMRAYNNLMSDDREQRSTTVPATEPVGPESAAATIQQE